MRPHRSDWLLGIIACGLALGAAGCSGGGGVAASSWPKPPRARVTAAAQLAYPTDATCHEGDDQIHDYDQSSWDCTEHPRHCDAPSDSVGEYGCWAISCDVHLAVMTKKQGTVDFYGCSRYNGDCQSMIGGCPGGDFVCVEGKGRELEVDAARSGSDYPDPCPYYNEVHPDS